MFCKMEFYHLTIEFKVFIKQIKYIITFYIFYKLLNTLSVNLAYKIFFKL